MYFSIVLNYVNSIDYKHASLRHVSISSVHTVLSKLAWCGANLVVAEGQILKQRELCAYGKMGVLVLRKWCIL